MDNNLVKSIVSHAKEFGLHFTQRKWPNHLKSNKIFDLEASLTINGETYRGYGMSFDSDVAIIKSAVEAIERAIAFEDKDIFSSNGVAGHSSLETAIRAASLELIERDSFFFHLFTRSTLNKVEYQGDAITHNFHDDFETLGYKLTFSKLKSAKETTCIHLSAVRNQEMLIGLGSGYNLDSAVLSSLEQLLRLAVILQDNPIAPLSVEHFNSLKKYNEHSHLGLCFDAAYIKEYSNWFSKDNLSDNNCPLSSVTSRLLQPKNEHLRKICDLLGLTFVKASSDLAQELYFGNATESKINHNKFKLIEILDVASIIPHPLC